MRGKNLIISLSGGKDSTALALLAMKKGWNIHSMVFFDTGWEFPGMYSHIKALARYVDFPLVRLEPKRPFCVELTVNRWPATGREWCRRSKINAINAYIKKHDGISLIGFSASERKRTRKKDFSTREVLFPLITWGYSEAACLEYCYKEGFFWYGLYELFHRLSCFCCPFKSLDEYRRIREYFPELWFKMLNWDRNLVAGNRGFCNKKTVYDLEVRFRNEDKI